MCIINLTNSKKLDQIITRFTTKKNNPTPILGAFVLSSSIQNIIQVNQKYSLITIHTNSVPPKLHLLHAMDQLTVSSIGMAMDRFEVLLERI